ncbi:MAG: hypothetical protein IJU16_02585 [Clostridia bacterium]|nr:hypothetical protein [Clostridia bacterium]
MKKLIALMLSFCMILSIIAIAMPASTVLGATVDPSEESIKGHVQKLAQIVDLSALREYLFEHAWNCEESIDVFDFGIPYTLEVVEWLKSFLYYDFPELFHLSGFGYGYNTKRNIITRLNFRYSYDAGAYHAMYYEAVESAQQLLQDIKGNGNLTEVQKALLLHDRVAVNCEYGYEAGNAAKSANMWSMLVDHKAICQGYSMAYIYMLRQVGMEAWYCVSATMNHGWVIVMVDGKPYHVDVTWDDVSQDITGRVYHYSFLLSTQALHDGNADWDCHNAHEAEDYDRSPQSTTYDNYFWQKSETAFQLIDGELYYIDATK